MERKTYTIFDSYDTYSEENKKDAKENIIDNMFDPFSFFPGLLIDLGLIIFIASLIDLLDLHFRNFSISFKTLFTV